jgi:hypothetical protein
MTSPRNNQEKTKTTLIVASDHDDWTYNMQK